MDTQKTTVEQQKKDFLRLYTEASDLTMFEAAEHCGLDNETLTYELKNDRNFFAEVKERYGLRVKREVMSKQKPTKRRKRNGK